MSSDEIKEIRDSEEFKDAFSIALQIHKKEHDNNAVNFRDCIECKSGFALLLIANLKNSRKKLRNE